MSRHKNPEGTPRVSTYHKEGYLDKKTAAREIAGRALALKILKEAMKPLMRSNRKRELYREEMKNELPEYFRSEEKLDAAYANGSLGVNTYYNYRGILRELNGTQARVVTKEEVAQRVLTEIYDNLYEDMEARELANMTDAERRSYLAKAAAKKRKENREKTEEDEKIREEIRAQADSGKE